MILSAPRRLRIYDCNNDICTQVTLTGDIVTSASARHTHYRYIRRTQQLTHYLAGFH